VVAAAVAVVVGTTLVGGGTVGGVVGKMVGGALVGADKVGCALGGVVGGGFAGVVSPHAVRNGERTIPDNPVMTLRRIIARRDMRVFHRSRVFIMRFLFPVRAYTCSMRACIILSTTLQYE